MKASVSYFISIYVRNPRGPAQIIRPLLIKESVVACNDIGNHKSHHKSSLNPSNISTTNSLIVEK